ncbi:accessory gland protein Acp36DE, putative (macronuclear) [Tetrahymena thermophila SB210]|uniref:Accessory gland protein Acp36DE, putative n=1 Tax=Tetrahymena thermophila (strain SB210) TaxID=312017 RepID=Q23MC1_TETTS|nr:accessory gland protein Acp36DE, putative [Tetrahymena thermophila SB210]EAR97718.3 accessory gland protein Acp36DE, putative [Tetrahymena thermophila SB210]|eukprot:XP_001017963.3 accessory gland protein Acp36DE, putative [Tetrahymena thermophila SB210]
MVFGQLNNCDIFGKQIILNYNQRSNVKTGFGGIFSILTLIAICLFFWNKFMDFINKNEVTVVSQQTFSNNPSLLTLNTSQFMFAVQIQQQTSFLQNPYYNITLEQKTYTLLQNGTRVIKTAPIDLEPCTLSHWQTLPESSLNNTFTQLNLKDYLCVKKNTTIYIGGQYESEIYQFLKFSISKCNNVTKPQFYSWNPVCQSYDSAIKYAQNQSVRVQFQMVNFIINANEPQNLVKEIVSSDLFFQIQPESMFTTADIFFTEYVIKTDNSLFFTQDIQEQDYQVQEYGDFRAQYSLYSKDPTKPYATFFFNRSRFDKLYTRQYMKLQDVLSQLGGFVNSMIAISAIIVGFYNSNYYVMELANQLYDFDILEENDKMNNNMILLQKKINPSFRKNIHIDDNQERRLSKNEQITMQYLQKMKSPSQNKETEGKEEIDNKSNQQQYKIELLKFSNEINNGSFKGATEQNQSQIKSDAQYKQNINIIHSNKDNDSPANFFAQNDENLKTQNFDYVSPQSMYERRLTTNEDDIQLLMGPSNSNNLIQYPSLLSQQSDNAQKSPRQQQPPIELKIQLPSIIEQDNEQHSIQKLEIYGEKKNSFKSNFGKFKFSPHKKNGSEQEDYFSWQTYQQNNEADKNNQSINVQTDNQSENFVLQDEKSFKSKDKQNGVKINNQKKEPNLANNGNHNQDKLNDSKSQKMNNHFIPIKIQMCQGNTSIENIDNNIEDENESHKKVEDTQISQQNQELKKEINEEKQEQIDPQSFDVNEEKKNLDKNQIRSFKEVKSIQNIQSYNNNITAYSTNYDLIDLKKPKQNNISKNRSISSELECHFDEPNSINIFSNNSKNQLHATSQKNFSSNLIPPIINSHENKTNQNANNRLLHANNINLSLKSPPRLSLNYKNPDQADLVSNNSMRSGRYYPDFHGEDQINRQNLDYDLESYQNNVIKKESFLQPPTNYNPNQNYEQTYRRESLAFLNDHNIFQQPRYHSHNELYNQGGNAKIILGNQLNKSFSNQNSFIKRDNASQDFNQNSTQGEQNVKISRSQRHTSYIESKSRRSIMSTELMKMNSRRKKINYSFKYIIYKLSCQKFFKTKENQMVDKAQDLIANNLDIMKILDKIQEIDRIKCLLLDYEQRILFSYFPKPLVEIKNDDQLQIQNSPLESMYQQYAQNLHTDDKTIKTVVKAKNKFKQIVQKKSKDQIQTIINSSLYKNLENKFDRTYSVNEYEQIYQAYKKISTKPQKTQTDKILIELMGQELQKIFQQLDEQRNKQSVKRSAMKKQSLSLKKNSSSNQNSQLQSQTKQSQMIKLDQQLIKFNTDSKSPDKNDKKKQFGKRARNITTEN